MKASLISKIILGICILCLFAAFFTADKYKAYEFDGDSSKSSIKTNTNKVAVIELEGIIATTYESTFFSKEKNASNLLRSLMALQTDNEIKGAIIKLNTPGGTVATSQNIYNQIKKLRTTKPVIVVFDDVSASGGYYIASAADRIIAQEGSLTGSIGVIFSFMDYHSLLTNKLSVNPIVIKSGKFKDVGSGSRAMTEEEKTLMQSIVDDSYSQFIDAITNGRIKRDDKYTAEKTNLTEQTLKQYADGRIFTGRQAQKLGFVDTLGDMDTAKSTIEKMVQEKFNNKLSVKLIEYSKKSFFTDYFSPLTEYNSQVKFNFEEFIPTSMILSKRPLYLWE